MDVLKKKIEETQDLLAFIKQKLHDQILLSNQDFFLVLSRMNDLNAIQTQTVKALVADIGCDAADCTSIEAMEALLAEYAAQQQLKLLEKELSDFVNAFANLAGEGDYGFAIQSFQENLAAKDMQDLIAMEQAGELQPYRQVLEFAERTGCFRRERRRSCCFGNSGSPRCRRFRHCG